MAKINREQRSPDKKATTRTTKRQSRCNTNLPESAPPEPNDDGVSRSFDEIGMDLSFLCRSREHDQYYHQPMRQYREEQRALYLKQLTKLGDSKSLPDEGKLRRCHFFHLFLIMSSSQGCKDEDGIERLNLLIQGNELALSPLLLPLPFFLSSDPLPSIFGSQITKSNENAEPSRATIYLLIIHIINYWQRYNQYSLQFIFADRI
eukprot:scaffold8773_cov142-Skeletonema_dohrnii-CCMP3373.AAC.2